MDYDGLSSPESQQTGEVVPHSLRNAARFVILWHAMPPKKPIVGLGNAEPMALATGYALSPKASAYVSEIKLAASYALSPGTSVDGSEKQGIQAENRASHFDLMLEKNGRLATFELFQLPIPGERFPVRRLAEHRIDYLDYEGPISGDRGHVTQWTAGHYLTAVESDNKWILELYSPRLSARIVLLRPTSDNITAATTWHLRASRWNVRN
ncbi:MAG: hypothetical protein NTW52_15810 [Planctomycetota bacterium]|nr:hypothetical protein [Planctomycetota bacterium]